jgi:hypothetical protein
MKVPQKKFVDNGEHLLDFMGEYFVVCPRCHKRATVAVIDSASPPRFSARRLTCVHCAYTSEWRGNCVGSGVREEPRDWYFHQPFFYCVPCCGNELWVLNQAHLEFLRKFVGARLRSRSANERGWSNRSLVSRLPRWISAAKHRDEILAALEKIEQVMKKQKTTSLLRSGAD